MRGVTDPCVLCLIAILLGGKRVLFLIGIIRISLFFVLKTFLQSVNEVGKLTKIITQIIKAVQERLHAKVCLSPVQI